MRKVGLLFVILQFTFSFAQQINATSTSKNKIQFALGSSATYIWYNDSPIHIYHELTWNTNVAFSYFDRLWMGIQVLPIFTKEIKALSTQKNLYNVAGLFFQYDIIKKNRWKAYGETSFNYGDYCVCGGDFPSRQNGLYYLGIGFGGQLPINFISQHLFLDIGFFDYVIISDNAMNGNYTQYVLGLNYLFGDLR